MLKPSDYVRLAKKALGDETMSDRALGELLGGFTSASVSNARYGNMSDPLAIKIAKVAGVSSGEVLMIARLEREKDPEVKAALSEWASKTLASMPKREAEHLDLQVPGGMVARRIVRGSASAKARI